MSEVVRYTFVEDELDSSALDTVWYNCFARCLYVRFPNKTVAGYRNVPPNVVRDLLEAESIGRYFANNIKLVYPGTSGSVEFEPFNSWSDINYEPRLFEAPTHPKPEPEDEPEAEVDDDDENGTYEISFMVEGSTTFSAPKGDIVKALDLFVGSFAERNSAVVRVRSIKEVE